MKTNNHSAIAITLIAFLTTPFVFAQSSGSAGDDDTAVNASAATETDSSASAGVFAPLLGEPGKTAITFELAVNFDALLSDLQSTTADQRDPALEQVAGSLDTSATTVAKLRSEIEDLTGVARARIDEAIHTVENRATAVRSALEKARGANADDFADARDELATSLKAYAEANAELTTTVEAVGGA